MRRPLRLHGFMTAAIAATASSSKPSEASDAAGPLPDATGPLAGAPALNIARVRSISCSTVLADEASAAASAACGKQWMRRSEGKWCADHVRDIYAAVLRWIGEGRNARSICSPHLHLLGIIGAIVNPVDLWSTDEAATSPMGFSTSVMTTVNAARASGDVVEETHRASGCTAAADSRCHAIHTRLQVSREKGGEGSVCSLALGDLQCHRNNLELFFSRRADRSTRHDAATPDAAARRARR